MLAPRPADPLRAVRRLLLGLLAFGLTGTLVELVLIEHYEEPTQTLPLVLIVVVLAAGVWQVRESRAALRVFRVLMVALMLAGAAGVVLHVRGSLAIQQDMDPDASTWDLIPKAIRAQAPPALAPGVLVQFGLLGLVFTYRHPALDRDGRSTQGETQ